ncbi:MAG: beta-galactosidase, partial [Lentisphaeria bacterium]|nr:beta-galactosidase [Lentisphaeria bacterium]
MKKFIFMMVLCFGASLLHAAEFTISAGKLKAVFDTRGGALKTLYLGDKALTYPDKKTLSFTEKVLRSEGKKQYVEEFSNLEFTPVALTRNSISFSAVGVQNFDFLRVTKTFSLDAKTNTMTVSYKFDNLSGKDSKAGIWSRTMLRRFDGMGMRNTYFHFRKGKLVKSIHPGNVSGDNWVMDTSSPVTAFMGNDDKTGAVVLPPQDLLCAFYNWFTGSNDLSTLEYFLREQKIPAGKSVEFDIKVIISENVPELLKKYAARPFTKAKGNVPAWLDYYVKNDKGVTAVFTGNGIMPRSRKTLDIQGKRQYCDSIRGVKIPGNLDPGMITVYNLANKAPEYDKPVPFTVEKLASGEQRILVFVPGINKQGYYFTKFKDGFAYNTRAKAPGFIGKDSFAYRICFDRKSEKTYPAELFKGGPDLAYNGSLERKAPNVPWADGYSWSYGVRSRKLFSWVDEGINNSKCIKLHRPKGSNFYCIWPVFFRPEQGVKYHFSANMRSENPDRAWVTCMIEFTDKNNKDVPKTRINVDCVKSSYRWKKVSYTFFKPQAAEAGVVRFGANSPLQYLWVDNVSIVPEDFSYSMRSPMELMRDELKETNYPALDFIEKLSHDTVTPHKKWMSNPVDLMPEILYLPLATTHSIQYTGKRQIVEFAQRMKLTYKFIPLLRWIESGAKAWNVVFGKKFEPYTIALLKEIKKSPKAVIVQDIDFSRIPSAAFISIVRKFQKDGSGILFYNCRNIPAELLGKQIATPEGIFATPELRKVPKNWFARSFTAWQNGKSRVICFTRSKSEYYLEAQNFPCVPKKFANERTPSYYSFDFPYWEYINVSALKSLRYVAGVEPEVKVIGNLKQGVRLKSAKAQTVLLNVVIKDMNRREKARFVQKAALKAGVNDVNFKVPYISGGINIADYRVTDLKGREFDFGAVNFTTPDTNKLTAVFADKDKVFERGGEVKVRVSAAGTIPAGSVLAYSVSDTNDRIVVKGNIKAGAQNDISFKVLPPYTTLYRLHLYLKSGSKELSRGFAEFSMPAKSKDLTYLDSLVWLGRNPYARLASQMGFTMWISSFMQNNESMGWFKTLRNSNLTPVMYGAGHANNTTDLKYRHDIPSDPVRTPCFSDPEHWKKAGAIIKAKVLQQRYRYYGILHHEIADEAYLGSMVCFAPHCLKDFRAELKKQYGTLEALNKTWNRKYKKWDEVMPVQLKELSSKDNLAPWLDHKMFMVKAFAKNWVGNTGKELRKYVPGSKVGLSGTQIPGYSYDWVQLMKHINCLSYYGGIQRKAVHDFAAPGFVAGMWGGGYAKAEE